MNKINNKQINIAFTFTKKALAQDKETGFWVTNDSKEVYLDSNKKENLKLYKTGKGYYQVSHQQDLFYVHRLVAGAFIPNPLNKPFVNSEAIDELEYVEDDGSEFKEYFGLVVDEVEHEVNDEVVPVAEEKKGNVTSISKYLSKSEQARVAGDTVVVVEDDDDWD